MARRKTIEDEKLLELIKEFYAINCAQGYQKIKLPLLAKYIAEKGFPGYRVESLRRNEKARSCIDALNQAMQNDSHDFVSTYKTLDVENFLNCNKTQASLRSALTALDAYYREISARASDISKQYKVLQREHEDALDLLKRKDDEIVNLTQKIRLYKENAVRAEAEIKRLKSIVNDYVYPDIANSLLAADGDLINAETIIDPEKLAVGMISGDTRIARKAEEPCKSAVVRNLFEKFEGD